MQSLTQTQTLEVYEADYGSYARLVAVLWTIAFTPVLLLTRLAAAEAFPHGAASAIGVWLLGPVGLAASYLAGLVNALIVIWAFNAAASWGGGVCVGVRCWEPVPAGEYELRRIELGPAALVGSLTGLCLGELFLEVMLTLIFASSSTQGGPSGVGIGILVVAFAVGGLLGGAINGLIVAAVYNLLAKLMGGVRFRMG